MRPAARRPSRLLLALVAVLLAVSGCAGSGSDEDSKASSDAGFTSADEAAPEAPAEGRADRDAMQRSVDDAAEFESLDGASNLVARPPNDSTGRKIIAQGSVSLESKDVADAAHDVQVIVDNHFGEITERETTTNKDGDISTARLLLRIPVKDFDKAFTELQEVADLKSSNTGKEDVTTRVIDTKVRIRAQRLSLARVEELFDRAQSISDIIRIETQVSRRQADLESLERRLHYLNNQTSMSTITVNISLPPVEKKKEKQKEKPEVTGFLDGLEAGWNALKSFSTDVATLTGRLLPFAGVLLVVGGPLWLLVRRFRGRGGDTPDLAAPADA